jgi:hypothetical protein
MSESPITVIMPLFRQPNFLSMSLYGLVKNSVTRPRILVVWSRREAYPEPAAWVGKFDFLINEQGEKVRRYATVEEWIEKHGDWATAHNIEFIEATQQGHGLRLDLGAAWVDGSDSAYKINLGIAMADTEYIVPNYDGDFFPSLAWDYNLLECMKRHDKPLHTWIPTHVQPKYFYMARAPWGADIEKSREVACTHLTWPTWHPDEVIHEPDWRDLCNELNSFREIIEPCGARQAAHWNPQAFRTEEFRAHIGGFPFGTGTDMEVDNIAGRAGFTKVSTYRAFILHKGWVPVPDDAHALPL